MLTAFGCFLLLLHVTVSLCACLPHSGAAAAAAAAAVAAGGDGNNDMTKEGVRSNCRTGFGFICAVMCVLVWSRASARIGSTITRFLWLMSKVRQ